MRIEEFALERCQSLYENTVPFNLTESGVHPYDLRSLLSPAELAELSSLELGYGWTNGAIELRRTIARLYERRDIGNVLVTNGSAEANFVMVMSRLTAGDELIFVVPNYLQISGWARSIGVNVRTVDLREEDGWLPDVAALRAAITPRTRMISLCNPNNPTGAVIPADQMKAIVSLAREHGLYLHAEEIYKGSELEQPEGPSFADLYEKSIVTNGLSKAMAMPGLRIGWLIASETEIAEAWHCKDYTSITTGTLSEFVAGKVLHPLARRRVLDRSKHILRENLAILQQWVATNSPAFSFRPPVAGGMAFLRYSLPMSSVEFMDRLRAEQGVFIVAGSIFGREGYIRIGIGVPAERLREGLARISAFMTR
jgi:aspartate/methionine/tyrosine aminotransferase